MEEGAEMIDAKQRDKLLETIQECSALFKALTS
jgi:hypothetical protein